MKKQSRQNLSERIVNAFRDVPKKGDNVIDMRPRIVAKMKTKQ